MRRRSLVHLVLATIAISLGGCLSPTLPLPPPEPDSIQESAAGVWIVSGSCAAGAVVTVFNATLGEGIVVEDRDRAGIYSVTVEASLCDTGWVDQTTEGETSAQTSFVFDKPSAMGTSSCH